LNLRPVDKEEPWSIIDAGIDAQFFENERDSSKNQVINSACNLTCDTECHICSNMAVQKKEYGKTEPFAQVEQVSILQPIDDTVHYYLIKFAKQNNMTLIGHIDMLRYFERIIYRSQLEVIFTEGFNPKPKMQFSPPLPVGMGSDYELALIKIKGRYRVEDLESYLNMFTHPDIPILDVVILPEGKKKLSLMELQKAARYRVKFNDKNLSEPLTKLVEKFKSDGLAYNFIRKNKELSGDFSDYLSFEDVHDSTVTLFVKKITPSPKLQQFCEAFAPGVQYTAHRLEQLSLYNDEYIDLYKFILL